VILGVLGRDYDHTSRSIYTRRLAEGTGVRSYYTAFPGCTRVGVVLSVSASP
jgi:hypothetical protein